MLRDVGKALHLAPCVCWPCAGTATSEWTHWTIRVNDFGVPVWCRQYGIRVDSMILGCMGLVLAPRQVGKREQAV